MIRKIVSLTLLLIFSIWFMVLWMYYSVLNSLNKENNEIDEHELTFVEEVENELRKS